MCIGCQRVIYDPVDSPKTKTYMCNTCIKMLDDLALKTHVEPSHIVYWLIDYNDCIKNILWMIKFKSWHYLANQCAIHINNVQGLNSLLTKYDDIIPVPLSKSKHRLRGFNQVEELFNTAITRLNKSMITRKKETPPLFHFKKKKRQKLLKHSFTLTVPMDSCVRKKYLIVDDIYTTGSTFNELQQLLHNNGAIQVDLLVLAKA